MDPTPLFKPGSLRNIFVSQPGQSLPPIVVQCLQVKNLSSDPNGQDRYRVVFSDTSHYCQTMLASQLNHIVKDGPLLKGSIVKLKSYTANQVNGRNILIVVELEILKEFGEMDKIGNPQTLEKISSGEAESSRQPISTNTTAALPTPAATNASNSASFYGSNRSSAQSRPQANTRPYGDSRANSGPSANNAHIVPIEALNPYQNKWTIKARVSHKSDIKNYRNQRGQGKLFTVHFLDESGEIRATGFNDQCDKFYELLQEREVYYISKCRVNIAKKQFSNVKNDYELMFERETEIEKCSDESDVPQLRFNFVPIANLKDLDKDAMIDVIGIVKEVGDLGEIVSKTSNKPYQKRDLTLVDQSGFSVRLTVWGAVAENFEVPEEMVVAFKGVRVGDFGGRSLSMLMSSSMSVDPDIDEAHRLKGWYDAQGRTESFNSHQNVDGMGAAGGRKDPVKTLIQVIDERLGQDEPFYYLTKATIVFIKEDSSTYPACSSPNCNRKVSQVEDGWRCEKCNKSYPRPEYRYMLTVSVNDAFAQAWLNCFDEVGKIIMGMSANELEALRGADGTDGEVVDEQAYQQAFLNANGKTYNFKVRAKLDTYNEIQRVRNQALSASPLDYKVECAKLAETIKLYAQD